jgi:uncharacterized membrane protein
MPHNRLLLAIMLALTALQIYWYGHAFPPAAVSPLLVTAIATLPLLLVTAWQSWRPGMGAVFSGLLLLLYFCKGVMEAWSNPPERVLALLEVALTTAFYVVLYFRVGFEKAQKKAL